MIFPVYKDRNQNCIYYRIYVEPYKRTVEWLILKNEMFEVNIIFIIHTGLTPIYFDSDPEGINYYFYNHADIRSSKKVDRSLSLFSATSFLSSLHQLQ